MLVGRLRDAPERLDELSEVPERATPLEQPEEAIDRLAELRIRVEGGQVVPRGGRFVARALFDLADLVKEPRLPGLVVCPRGLGAQADEEPCHLLQRIDRRRWNARPEDRLRRLAWCDRDRGHRRGARAPRAVTDELKRVGALARRET